jgi:hypothetical protein
MKNKFLILLGILIIFLIPSLAHATGGDFNWVYFHYENSKFVEQYANLKYINEFFEKYFSFEIYIKLVILAYTIIAMILTWEVVKGKKNIMIFWEKFFFESWGSNIITKMALIVFGYFLFLFPVPVIQVAPIVAPVVQNANGSTNSSGALEVIGWAIDEKHSKLDTNGNLLHVPILIGIPLGLVERLVYGFPVAGLSAGLDLTFHPDTKRKTIASVDNTVNYDTITTSSCPVTGNQVSITAITQCKSDLQSANLAPSTFSLLDKTNNESASIFVNVATPFKKFESLLRFQKDFLSSISVEEDTELNTDKVIKNRKIFEEYMADSNGAEKYLDTIKPLFEERVKKINDMLREQFEKYIVFEKAAKSKKNYGGFLRAYIDEILLNDVAKIYTTEPWHGDITDTTVKTAVENNTHDFLSAPRSGTGDEIVVSAIKQRNTIQTNMHNNTQTYMQIDKMLNIDSQISTTATINNEIYVTPSGYNCEPNYKASPFKFSNNNDYIIDMDEELICSSLTSDSEEGALFRLFWHNFKTKIFTKLKQIIDAQGTLSYYQSTPTAAILKNLGINISNAELTSTAANLSKIDKIGAYIFILDALSAYVESKKNEANNRLFDITGMSWEELKKLSQDEKEDLISNKAGEVSERWLKNQEMVMGLIYDDYSFYETKVSNNKIGNNHLLLVRVQDEAGLRLLSDNTKDTVNDLYEYKNINNQIQKFLCDNAGGVTETNVTNLCIMEISSSSITLNEKTLLNMNTDQSIIFGEIINSKAMSDKPILNENEKVDTKKANVTNPCKKDPTGVQCAKFVKQELLKGASAQMLESIGTTTSPTMNDITSIEFVYAGVLRNAHSQIKSLLARPGDPISDTPICRKQLMSDDKVTVSGAEAYNDFKTMLGKALNSTTNYVGQQVSIMASTLEALNEKQLQINNTSFSSDGIHITTGDDPFLSFHKINFSPKILSGMLEFADSIGAQIDNTAQSCVAGSNNPDAKQICQIIADFKTVTDATADKDTLRKQINYLISFLALKTSMAPVDSTMLVSAFRIYADIIGSFYNRTVMVSNADTIKGIKKIEGIYPLLYGGDFENNDGIVYDFSYLRNHRMSYTLSLSIPRDICSSIQIEKDLTQVVKETYDEAKSYLRTLGNDTFISMPKMILVSIFMFFITLYSVAALMIPFFYILVFSIIATAIGWISAVSLAYITILNMIVLSNLGDIDFINENWKIPSQKITVYLIKAILSSVGLYLYLVITVYLIDKVIVPLGTDITMNYIITAITSSDGVSLPMWFNSVTFILVSIYFVYMKFTLKAIKDWYYQEVISPTQVAVQKAQEFAKKLKS